ncbi:hypothetical protein CMUS01_15461 [Colletotrichum musicola]|uniref:Uncharacterized protein n=1 Tax=Colletotrichum musicola TaxID=2175873 RepID=A0A8H6IW95_9PEZI|nr:hypothetical protein CMUS01_15461 [Colletotrichum musicola]
MAAQSASQRLETTPSPPGGSEDVLSGDVSPSSTSGHTTSDWDEVARRTRIECPVRWQPLINPALWGNWTIPAEGLNEDHANVAVMFLMGTYEAEDLFGRYLWARFCEDFADWGETEFQYIRRGIFIAFRNFLITNGVYLNREITPMRRLFAMAVDQGKFHIWTKEELEEAIDEFPKLNDRLNDPMPRRQETVTPPNPISPQPQDDPGDIKKKIETLQRTYEKDPSMKYGGEKYEILDNKALAFKFECDINGLNDKGYAMAFNRMLKGEARDFYLQNVNGSGAEFDIKTAMTMVRDRFETKQRRQEYITELRRLDLARMMRHNPDKTPEEVFNLLAKKFELLVIATATLSATDGPFQRLTAMNDAQKKEHLINACSDVADTQLIAINEAETYEGVKSQLRDILSRSRTKHASQHVAAKVQNYTDPMLRVATMCPSSGIA